MAIRTLDGVDVAGKRVLLRADLNVPVRDGKPVANAPAPGKRPMSAMAPTIMFDRSGHFAIALGSPGGPAIIPYVAETLVAMIDGRPVSALAAAMAASTASTSLPSATRWTCHS